MKFGRLIEYNKEIFFLKNVAEVKAKRLVPGLFFSGKALYEVKTIAQHLSFSIFW